MTDSIFPKHLQIETVNGICTARCDMCTIRQWKRKPNCMRFEIFKKILSKYVHLKDHLEFLTLHGAGEPLLDSGLPDKIATAKQMNFRGIRFASNCTLLTEKVAIAILNAGLDTIICSIDGLDKQTHESIRRGTDFDQVKENVLRFIKIRNDSGTTKVIIRFIRQKINAVQWEDFRSYWKSELNDCFGDDVLTLDIHNWGGDLNDFEHKDMHYGKRIEKLICSDVFDRMLIGSSGEVSLCCADGDADYMGIGSNVLDSDPIEIFNNYVFRQYREKMLAGDILDLPRCNKCTSVRSRYIKQVQI